MGASSPDQPTPQPHLGGFEDSAIAWMQNAPGVWEQIQIRRCLCCVKFHWQRLHYVDFMYYTCIFCFSQDVVPVERPDRDPAVRCRVCGAVTEADEPDHVEEEDEPESSSELDLGQPYDPDADDDVEL